MSIPRVLYAERQVLHADDLNDEQAERIAVRRRHNLAAHGWGILAGLRLKIEDAKLVLKPGAALDGYGRELYVPGDIMVAEDFFRSFAADDSPSVVLDFWLRYAREPATPPHPGIYAAGEGKHTRWVERTVLCATTQVEELDPRRPPGVPPDDFGDGNHQGLPGDFGYVPYRDPPDDAEHSWPVFLGRVEFNGADAQRKYIIRDESLRPYAGLVGEVVRSVSREMVSDDSKAPQPPQPVQAAEMELARAQPGRPAFAVRIPNPSDQMVERLALLSSSEAILRGDLTAYGNLNLAGLELRASAESPNIALPWHIYRVTEEVGGRKVNELRIEIAHPDKTDDVGLCQFVIGHTQISSGQAHFQPDLTVRADGTVKVHSRLKVIGAFLPAG